MKNRFKISILLGLYSKIRKIEIYKPLLDSLPKSGHPLWRSDRVQRKIADNHTLFESRKFLSFERYKVGQKSVASD